MKSEISPKLRNFYQELLKWIDMGCPGDLPFNKSLGLCSNILKFDEELFEEQKILLQIECGFSGFPFNQTVAGDCGYLQDYFNGTMYTNPKRLAFIRKYAGEDND